MDTQRGSVIFPSSHSYQRTELELEPKKADARLWTITTTQWNSGEGVRWYLALILVDILGPSKNLKAIALSVFPIRYS